MCICKEKGVILSHIGENGEFSLGYDRHAGTVYVFDQDNVQQLGLRLEGLMVPHLLRRQRKVDAGYAAVRATLPRLMSVERDGRESSPWN